MPKTSIELANMFLRGRDSAWLSIKQTKWIVDVLNQERGIENRERRYFLNTDQVNNNPHGYELNVAPSLTSLLKPSPCPGSDCRVCGELAAKVCAKVGHDFSGDGYQASVGPDSGSESFDCRRCGFSAEVTYY